MRPAPQLPPAFRLPDEVHAEALELLRAMLRIDTTNPPGNERAAAELLADWLSDRGLEPKLLDSAPGRTNLVCRLDGTGDAGGPLLLNGHLDVVSAEPECWSHPPFSADVADGWIWGRGALDMKSMVAMSAVVMSLAKQAGAPPGRTLILAAVADEEAGSALGSSWLVDHHPDEVRAELALGEVGGFPVWVGERPFIPVMVAEKGTAWLRLRCRGEPGHGSTPRPDTAVVRLAEAVARIGRTRLPQHVTPPVERYLRTLAAHQPLARRLLLGRLLDPRLSGLILDHVLPDKRLAAVFSASLSNTAAPTVLRAGTQTNVIPGEATVELDGRTLPGQTAADLIAELRALIGDEPEIELLSEQPPSVFPTQTPLMEAIGAVVAEALPDAVLLPNLIPGFTDAKQWGRLGAVAYGFSPIWFPPDAGTTANALFHAHDERIPVDGYRWGTSVLNAVVGRLLG